MQEWCAVAQAIRVRSIEVCGHIARYADSPNLVEMYKRDCKVLNWLDSLSIDILNEGVIIKVEKEDNKQTN